MGLLIDMIGVGQGDSFLLTIDGANGEAYVLIDAGLPAAGTKVLQYVNDYAAAGLDMIIATHLDNDHIGGLATILAHAQIKPNAIFVLNVPPAIKKHWTPARNTLEKYKGILSFQKVIDAVDAVKSLTALANRRSMIQIEALQGRQWTYGGVRLNVLNPTPDRLATAWEESRLDQYISEGWADSLISYAEALAKAPATSAENDSSIVIEITLNEVPQALMTSDAGAAVLKEVTNKKSYPILKVPHHGSETGLDEDLVKQISPTYAAIPVGDNPHGHPSIKVLNLLRKYGAKTYCSSKTKDCRRSCTFKGGDISFPVHKPLHANWVQLDPGQCENNLQQAQRNA